MDGIINGLILAASPHIDATTMRAVSFVVGVMSALGGAVVGSVTAVLYWRSSGNRLVSVLVGMLAGAPMGALVGTVLGWALPHEVGAGTGLLVGLLGGAIGGFLGSGLGTTGKVLS